MNALLTVDDAAKYLRLNRFTVLKKVRAGQLAHVRLGPNVIRFTRQQLEDYVSERAVA